MLWSGRLCGAKDVHDPDDRPRAPRDAKVQNALRRGLALPRWMGLAVRIGLADDPPDAWAGDRVAMAPRRRQTFLWGRHCARAALDAAGFAGTAPLPVGGDRQPVWPHGWRGSISHSDHAALAIAAPVAACAEIGVDLEPLMPAEGAREIAALVAKAPECALLADHPPGQAVPLILSAKEALFKALYPHAGRFMDFPSAALVRRRGGILLLRLTVDWNDRRRAGTVVRVCTTILEGHAVAACWRPAAHRPR